MVREQVGVKDGDKICKDDMRGSHRRFVIIRAAISIDTANIVIDAPVLEGGKVGIAFILCQQIIQCVDAKRIEEPNRRINARIINDFKVE
jgi:hypothetical protein